MRDAGVHFYLCDRADPFGDEGNFMSCGHGEQLEDFVPFDDILAPVLVQVVTIRANHTSLVMLSSSLFRVSAEVCLYLSLNSHKRSEATVYFSSMYSLLGSSVSLSVTGYVITSSETRLFRL